MHRIYPNGTYFIVARGGYRGYLAELLGDPTRLPQDAAALPSWSYVGTQFLCGAHEGYAGETVAWLSNITTEVVTKNQPDIILFMAGTNDFFWPPPRGSRSPDEVATRLRGLLNRTFAAAPRVTFLISTVTTIDVARCKTYHTARWRPGDCPSDMPSNIAAYNRLLPGAKPPLLRNSHLKTINVPRQAGAREKHGIFLTNEASFAGIVAEYKAAGHDIALHDVNADAQWTEGDRWIWGIHFNSSGFEKMAASCANCHCSPLDLAPSSVAENPRLLGASARSGQRSHHCMVGWFFSGHKALMGAAPMRRAMGLN